MIQVPASLLSTPVIAETIPRINTTSVSSPHCSIASRTRSKTSSVPVVSTLSPIASRTRLKYQALFSYQILTHDIHHAIRRFYEFSATLAHNSLPEIANAILDVDSGKMLEYRQLIHHKNLKIRDTWTTSAADEFR